MMKLILFRPYSHYSMPLIRASNKKYFTACKTNKQESDYATATKIVQEPNQNPTHRVKSILTLPESSFAMAENASSDRSMVP